MLAVLSVMPESILSRSRSQDSAEAGSGDAKEKTQQIPQALTGRGEKTAKGNGHDCGGQKDADDPVESQTIVMVKTALIPAGIRTAGDRCPIP